MRLLLDTHVVLWWLLDDVRLSDETKALIDEEPDVYLSAASVWEIAIKQGVGKLKEPAGLPERLRDSEFNDLPIRTEHAIVAGRLPLIHRDPFDRILIAQARCEDLTLVTGDPQIRRYDVAVLAV